MFRNLFTSQAKHAEFLLLYDSNCPMCCAFLRLLDTYIDPQLASVNVCASASDFALINSHFRDLKSNVELMYLDQKVKDTIVLIDLKSGKVKDRSFAIFSLLGCVKYPLIRIMSRINFIPKFISDIVYDLVAHNRIRLSKLLGFKDSCVLSFSKLKLNNIS